MDLLTQFKKLISLWCTHEDKLTTKMVFWLRGLIIAEDARALADRTWEYRNEPVDLHGDAFARVESQPSRINARARYSYCRRQPLSIVKQDVPQFYSISLYLGQQISTTSTLTLILNDAVKYEDKMKLKRKEIQFVTSWPQHNLVNANNMILCSEK